MSSRIVGFDLARALAYLGMVVVNFEVVMAGGVAEPGWLRWVVTRLEGRASATFVILAGIGLSLMASAPERHPATRKRLLGRALFLFVVGLLYMPLWPGDILHYYGVYIALGALLLGASSRTLWALAGALAAAAAAGVLLLDYEAGWDWTTLYYEGFWTPAGFLRNLLFNGFHPVVPWLAFLLVGMALGRVDWRDPRRRRLIGTAALVTALAAEGLSRLLVAWATPVLGGDAETAAALLGAASMPPLPLYLLAAGATAVAAIALALEIGASGARWLTPLVHTGQLALTLYVAHVVVGMGALALIGRLEHQTLPFAVACAVAFCVLSVGFAHLWRRRFARGPLERLMRRISG